MKVARKLGLAGAWAGLAWVMLFHGLDSLGLIGPDEPRYAQVAAAMWARRDFITPWLWGAPWLEKPALYYWLAAAGNGLLGRGEIAARLPSALMAALLSLILFGLLRRAANSRVAALAAFLSLTCVGVFGFGHAASTDMTLAATLTGCLAALYIARNSGRAGWYLAAAATLGLATLAKGPVAVVLAGAIWLAWLAWQHDWPQLPRALAPLPLLVFATVTLPWYLAVQMRNPEFARAFFLQHNLERFATNAYQHPEPVWYYLPVFLALLFPWSGWLAPALAHGRGRADPLFRFLLLWMLVPLAFFTLSHSKLPGYVLPAAPAAIALIAIEIDRGWARLSRRWLAVNAAAVALIPAAVWMLPRFFITPRLRTGWWHAPGWEPALALGIGCGAALGVLAWRRRGLALLAASAILVAGGVFAATHPPLSDDIDMYASGRPVARIVDKLFPSHPVYAWQLNRNTQYGVQYYFNRALPEWPPAGNVPTGAVVLIDADRLRDFATRFGPPKGIWELPHTAVLEAGP